MRLIFTNLGLQLGCQIQLHETLLPTCTQHVSMLPTHALSAGHAWAQPGPAFGGGARGPYLRAARAAAAVRADRPERATYTKQFRAVPARPLGSGTCAALPRGGCSGCAGGVPDGAPAAEHPPPDHLVLCGAEVIRIARSRSAWCAGWRWKEESETKKSV